MRCTFSGHYLPCVAYFQEIYHHTTDVVHLWSNEPYVKQSYRNRAYVLGPHRVEMLILPVHAPQGILMQDVTLDNHERWAINHWRTIETAYRKSPFFEHYEPFLNPLFHQRNEWLLAFQADLMKMLLRLLGIKRTLMFAGKGEINPTEYLHPKRQEDWPILVPYRQNFGDQWVPNLSILDLLFMQGPNAKEILRNGQPKCHFLQK